MPDEVTNAELARRLGYLGDELRDDLKEIKAQISHLVPREVYDAQRGETDRRLAALEVEARARAEQRRSDVRWLIGAVLLPVVLVIIQMVLSARGVRP